MAGKEKETGTEWKEVQVVYDIENSNFKYFF